MPVSQYKVELTQSERSALIETSGRGKPLARTVKRALALLKADEGLLDREVAEAVSLSVATVARVRRRFVEEGLEAAINDRPRSGRERKLSGRQEAHLVAIACSNAPEGHTNWTLQLLANQVVAMEFAGSISLETVRQILKKTNSNHSQAPGVSPHSHAWKLAEHGRDRVERLQQTVSEPPGRR